MFRRPSLLLLGLAFLASVSATPSALDDRSLAGALDSYTKPLIDRGHLSGQLLVVRNGRIVLERSFGSANVEVGAAVTTETRFNIASVTKPMTSVVAIQLMDEGKLGLRDSIVRWLPGFPKGDSIRVEHLLRHRSGIPHEIVPDSEMIRPFSAAEVAERAQRRPLDFSPGARGSYSSGGFEVLACVLERTSGKSYRELVAERIFQPLEMTSTLHEDSRALMPGRATGYVLGPHGLENAPLRDFSALVGAGSVWSTARDLRRFVEAIVTGKLGENIRASFVRGARLDFNGRTGGFKAWALWDSASGVGAIFAGNVSSGAPDALKRDILRLVAGERVAPPALPVLRAKPTPVEDLRRWEGVYQIEHGPRLDVRVRNGALYSSDWVMLPTEDGGMFSPRDYGVVRAVPGADGKIARLDWKQGSDTYPAPRVAD